MSAGCVRWVLSRAVRAVCGGSPGYWTPASRFTICSERSNIIASSWRWSPFSTAVDDTEQPPAPKKKKQDSKARIGSVGRKIPQRHIHVIGDAGESLGTMHRADVIRIMDEKGLKLVLVDEHKDPPVYQLMTGKQVFEEQMKLWEKQKAKAGMCIWKGPASDLSLTQWKEHISDTYFWNYISHISLLVQCQEVLPFWGSTDYSHSAIWVHKITFCLKCS